MNALPVLVLLTRHWVGMTGTVLVTLAGTLWLFLLVFQRGLNNPYIGLLTSLAIPVLFFAGLILIPIGIVFAKRKHLVPSHLHWRRVSLFFAVTTFANIVIGSQITYRAVEEMDSVRFCGQACHAMNPEFVAHRSPPHQRVDCVSCHVVPGAAGWVEAKTAGTRQLFATLLNAYVRPIEPALASGRLAPSSDTCEQCHARQRPVSPVVRVFKTFGDDEANTPTWTVLNVEAEAIHSAHLGPGVRIRFAAEDRERKAVPWVEYRNQAEGPRVTFLTAGKTAAAFDSLPRFEMECADCHNRPAHIFELPEAAVDHAMADGEIPVSLPYIKKTSVELLRAGYTDQAEAARKIVGNLASYYQQNYPSAAAGEVDRAAKALISIYNRNVFPDLKVTWGTYPSNLGHSEAQGCFRCHDGNHATAEGKTIQQNCVSCHRMLAVGEPSPAVLKTLGIE